HRDEDHELDDADDPRNAGPAEDQVEHAEPDLAQVELVHPEAAEEKGEQGCRDPVLAVRRRGAVLPDAAVRADLGFSANTRSAFRTELLVSRSRVHGRGVPPRPGGLGTSYASPNRCPPNDDRRALFPAGGHSLPFVVTGPHDYDATWITIRRHEGSVGADSFTGFRARRLWFGSRAVRRWWRRGRRSVGWRRGHWG